MDEQKSSPSRVMGVVIREVTLAGVKYTLSQPTKVRKAADEEAVMISRRLDMLPAITRSCAGLPPEEAAAWRRDFIASMMAGMASPTEWTAYWNSLWRLAFLFWNALDPTQKGKRSLLDGVSWAFEQIHNDDTTAEELESLRLAIEVVGQEQALGESSGSAA